MTRGVLRNSHLTRDERGFSLIELLVSSALFIVVITIVASIVGSALNADREVRDVTGSTTDGQLAANLITQTVRNSTAIQVSPVPDSLSASVRVRTTAGGAARCLAFYFDEPSGRIFQSSSSSLIQVPTPTALGSEWTVVSDGIIPAIGEEDDPLPVFARDGDRGLTLTFRVDAGSGPASLIMTAVTGRGPDKNEDPKCF